MPERVALITGGGSGIGRATAEVFAANGWRVMISGRREAPLAEVAGAHPAVGYHVADVSDGDQAQALVQRTVDTYGRLDTLVNNAGVFSPTPVGATEPRRVAELFHTNVFAPVHLLQAAVPHLRAIGGSVVNVSSAVAHHPPGAGVSIYGASKAALDYLTRSWALELAEHGIRVNAVAPGPTDTLIRAPDVSVEENELRKKAQGEQLPLRRLGEPAEVARWIHLLAEPASSWVTGQVIAVDGGMTLA
jgi:NAD(P)-dependent dehydrogenase (short-subunit alcohol dehydrogenase family)